MNMTEQYIRLHRQSGKYVNVSDALPIKSFRHRRGWTDIPVDGELIYSHRNTYFTRESFSEGLHAHEYYELIIYIGGDIEYISENTVISPSPYTAVWFKPGVIHTARLVSASKYERYVLYFTPQFFRIGDSCTPMTEFTENSESFAVKIPDGMTDALLTLLNKADSVTELDEPYSELLLKAYVTELFGMLNSTPLEAETVGQFSETAAEIKRYIDKEYANIGTVSDIADKFFYSREHLSRKFRETYNIHISKYLAKRRVIESLGLLKKMNVSDAAYAVGFNSQSSYIAAFQENMGCLPSEYKARNKQNP